MSLYDTPGGVLKQEGAIMPQMRRTSFTPRVGKRSARGVNRQVRGRADLSMAGFRSVARTSGMRPFGTQILLGRSGSNR